MWEQLATSLLPSIAGGLASNAFSGLNTSSLDRISKQYADMNQDDFDFYKDNYRPVEKNLISLSQGLDTQNVIDRGLKHFDGLATRQNNAQQRHLGRYGTQQSQRVQESNQLQNAMNNMAQRTNYVNNARNALEDRNIALKQDLVGLGRTLNTNALGAMGNTAASATQQAAQANAMQTDNFNNTMQNIGSGVMNFLSKPATSSTPAASATSPATDMGYGYWDANTAQWING